MKQTSFATASRPDRGVLKSVAVCFLAPLSIAGGSLLVTFCDSDAILCFSAVLLSLPLWLKIRRPKERTEYKVLLFCVPFACLVISVFIVYGFARGLEWRIGALSIALGILGGLLYARWLLIALGEVFSGLYRPALYLVYISELPGTGVKDNQERWSTLLGSLQTILSSFSFWALSFAWLLLLVRMSRGGRGFASNVDFWFVLGAALLLTNSVRVYTFIASTSQARMLLLNFLVAFGVTAMTALPLVLASSKLDTDSKWIPLVQFSSPGLSSPTWYLTFIIGLLGVVSGETLLWAALPFMDVSRSYYEFLAEGGGRAETVADSRTDFMQAATKLAVEVQSRGSGIIKIATQTAGQEWDALQSCLHSMFPESGSAARFQLQLLCPPHPSNLERIAGWLARDGVSVFCAEHMAKSSLKFMIGKAPGFLSVLIGRPSQDLFVGQRHFAKSRWGYVFDDPTVAASHEALFDSMKEAGNTGQTLPEILLRAFVRHKIGVSPSSTPASIVGDGGSCAVWAESQSARALKLSISDGVAKLEGSGAGWEPFTKGTGPFVRLTGEKTRGDFFLALDFDGVCCEAIHLRKLVMSIVKKDAIVDIAERHLRRGEEQKIEMSLRQLCQMCRGLPYESFRKTAEKMKLRESAFKIVKDAHQKGYRVAIITNGCKEFVQLCVQHHAWPVDSIWGTELPFQDGNCLGKARGELVRPAAKGLVVEALSTIWDARPICVGDGWNDNYMFRSAINLKGKAYLFRKCDEIAHDICSVSSLVVTHVQDLETVLKDL